MFKIKINVSLSRDIKQMSDVSECAYFSVQDYILHGSSSCQNLESFISLI